MFEGLSSATFRLRLLKRTALTAQITRDSSVKYFMVVELREGGSWRVYISGPGLCSVVFSGIVLERLDQLLAVSRNAFNFLGAVEIEKT